jgi:hypothetical protein
VEGKWLALGRVDEDGERAGDWFGHGNIREKAGRQAAS